MTSVLGLRPPAKINLSLRVLGRRPDGYHEIETVFHAIDLRDELVAARCDGPGVGLTVRDAAGRGLPVACGADNLVVRAARAVLDRVDQDVGLRFHLVKRIPAGAGLGGGSSDAAAALRLANALLGGPLDAIEIAALAVGLGADVPFFLHGGTCLAGGIGDVLWPVSDPPHFELVLILPPFGTPTGRVFELLGARLIEAAGPGTLRRIEPPTATEIALTMQQGNHLEEAAMECAPALRGLRERARSLGVPDVRMSGSGSTLFVARRSTDEADAVLASFERGLAGFADGPVALIRASSVGPASAPEPCPWPESPGVSDPGES